MIRYLGYPCDNYNIKKSACHSCRKKTVEEQGLGYVSDLILKNLIELKEILEWNVSNGIQFYRISSGLFPNRAFYTMEQLPKLDIIKESCQVVGKFIRDNDLRVSFHPDHYCVIASHRPEVVERSIHDLNMHGRILDMMGLERSHKFKINIHVGTTQGGKEEAAKRFLDSYRRLSKATICRLTTENDDRASGYSVKDLYEMIYKVEAIPIVFDYHHHRFNDGGLTEKEALDMSFYTWPDGITPVVHYSESWCYEQNDTSKPQRHSKYVSNVIHTHGKTVDVMLECKAKDLALLRYKDEYEKSILFNRTLC